MAIAINMDYFPDMDMMNIDMDIEMVWFLCVHVK